MGGMTPEGDAGADDMHTARDDESDEIVRQLERGLPRWDGFDDGGWMAEIGAVSCLSVKCRTQYVDFGCRTNILPSCTQ